MARKKKVVKTAKKSSLARKKSVIAKKSPVAKKKRSILSPAVIKRTSRKTPRINRKNLELAIEKSKYFPGPVIQKFEETKSFELPTSYGDNRIVLMVRDPYWLYSYWELTSSRIDEIKSELGDKFYSASLILRIYDTSNWRFFDINVHGKTGNWYINVGRPNTSYCVDIGYLTSDGSFICAARSNIITTPRDKMSEIIDEEWMIPDWEKMYALSGGFGRGNGSKEIREIIERRQWMGMSSSPVKKPNDQRKK